MPALRCRPSTTSRTSSTTSSRASSKSRRAPRAAAEPAAPGMNVFLGITGASGAPYAARLVRALTEAGAEVGVCASESGLKVIATELYQDDTLSRDEVL